MCIRDRYFNEQANDYHIVAAGSLLGIKLSKPYTFPVGKVNFLQLFPLSFFEFLEATGKKNLRSLLENQASFEPLPLTFHQELIETLKFYTFIGGMPEAVQEYIQTKDTNKIREIHLEILSASIR